MKNILKNAGMLLILLLLGACTGELEKQFKNPPAEFRPMPFWRVDGGMTEERIEKEISAAGKLGHYGGVTAYPVTEVSRNSSQTYSPYLSETYFERYQHILETARREDIHVIIYDDNDFPSGMAGGKMEELYPEYTRKRLDKHETEVQGPGTYRKSLPEGQLMSAVAMNAETLERRELYGFIDDGMLEWPVPEGKWKVMLFNMVVDGSHKKFLVADYMDTTAVRYLMDLTYDEYEARFAPYLGNVIRQTFFDDVGMFRYGRSWTGRFNQKFKEINGFDPGPWYPAMWYNIGPKTEAIRYAFFNTRAELLAEGFPRMVAEWARKNGIKDSGHPPGNYDPTPVDMNGDIFKFYRHTSIPLADAIFHYGFGEDGFKLVSSAADYYDRPVVAAEIYCAFPRDTFDSLMLYRPLMDMLVRGVNFFIPCSMCYNCSTAELAESSEYDPVPAILRNYSEFTGRSCMLLQGGRKVSDIGLIYPIETLAGWFHFDSPHKHKYGTFVPPETNYQELGAWLTKEIRRDFTFVHPELFSGEKYTIGDGTIRLNNLENTQEYRAIILPASRIVSVSMLEKLRDFCQKGGVLIATSRLPDKATEPEKNYRVPELIEEIFGIPGGSGNASSREFFREHANGGVAVFVPEPAPEKLSDLLDRHLPAADVRIMDNDIRISGPGYFSYIHKVRKGKQIFYFANSSDESIHTEIRLRGNMALEAWDPHTGENLGPVNSTRVESGPAEYTSILLSLKPVSSIFYVGD